MFAPVVALVDTQLAGHLRDRLSGLPNNAHRARLEVLIVPVADQEPKLFGAVAEVHEQVAGLLGHPGPGGIGGDSGDVHAAAAVLDHDEDVEAAQEDGVDVGEVDGEDRVAPAR
jgi:hypothetical protein